MIHFDIFNLNNLILLFRRCEGILLSQIKMLPGVRNHHFKRRNVTEQRYSHFHKKSLFARRLACGIIVGIDGIFLSLVLSIVAGREGMIMATMVICATLDRKWKVSTGTRTRTGKGIVYSYDTFNYYYAFVHRVSTSGHFNSLYFTKL